MAKTIVYCLLITTLGILTDANEKHIRIVNHHYKLPNHYISYEPSSSSTSSTAPSSSSSTLPSSTLENYQKASRLPKSNSNTYPSMNRVFTINNAQVSDLNEIMSKMLGNMRTSFGSNGSDGNNFVQTTNMNRMGPAGQGLMDMGSLQNQQNDNRQNKNILIKSIVVRTCCYQGQCRTLKEGEKCNSFDDLTNTQNDEQKTMSMDQVAGKPNYIVKDGGLNTGSGRLVNQNSESPTKVPISTTVVPNNNGAGAQTFCKQSGTQISPAMHEFLKRFSSTGGLNNNGAGVQTTGKQPGTQTSPMKYTQTFSDFGGLGGHMMGSYVKKPEKKKPTSHPYVVPIGFTEEEAKNIRNQVLERSNMYRQKYGIAPLIMDEQINNFAQDWANQVTKMPTSDHRPMNEQLYGENIYGSSQSEDLGEAAVDAWYGEIIDYHLGDDDWAILNNGQIHHLTQLLWIASKKMGVGVSKSPDNTYNVIVNYDPAGNVQGSFIENLPNITQENIDEGEEIVKQAEIRSQNNMKWTTVSMPETTYY